MGKKKAHFIESKVEPFQFSECDKCGLIVREVQDGKQFWNPNPKARDRNICRNCYDVFNHKKEEGRRIWKEKHAAMELEKKSK